MNDTELPAPNIPLLRKAVEWAEAEAAKTDGTGLWNQELFFQDKPCGTAYCIAGFVVASQPGYEKATWGWGWPTIDGRDANFWSDGQQLLGLTRDESELFAPDNTIADVRRIAEQIAARAGERL